MQDHKILEADLPQVLVPHVRMQITVPTQASSVRIPIEQHECADPTKIIDVHMAIENNIDMNTAMRGSDPTLAQGDMVTV